MDSTKREVNPTNVDVETIAYVPDGDTDDTDEVIVPAIDEDEVSSENIEAVNKTIESQNTTTVEKVSDTSTDTKPESKGNPASVPSQHPKPVEGETPAERGLRRDNEALRAKLRALEAAKTFEAAKPQPPQHDPRLAKLKEKYSDEEFSNLMEVVDVVASAKGYVRKDESLKQAAQEVLEIFIDEHKEYAPEFDKDDIHWNRFQAILASDYNLGGKTPRQLKTIYEKVHRDVVLELGDIAVRVDPNKKERERNASEQKIASASHGGGTKAPTAQDGKRAPAIDPSVRKYFKDFTDEDFLP